MDQEKKPKLRCSDFIFRFRHCLAFITILVFIFTYGMVAYCAQTGSYVTYDLITYYSIQDNAIPLGYDVVFQRASLDGFDTTKITASPSGVYANDLPAFMNGTSATKFYVVDSIADDSTQITYDFSSARYHVFYKSATSSNTFSYAMYGDGNFALLGIASNNFVVVSDAPFVFGRYQDWGSGGSYWANQVATPLANGLYVQSDTYMQIGFTDMPYYLPTSDSSSGWSSYSTSSTDFSFDSDNYDFNYALTGDLIVNPNAPSPSGGGDYEHNMYLNATEKMMQNRSTSYNGSFFPDTDRIFIAYNSFIAQNQDKYKIKVTYSADLKGTAEAPNAFYSDYVFDEHFEVVKFVSLTDFTNGVYDMNLGTEFSYAPATIGGVLSSATNSGVYRLMSNVTNTSDFSTFLGMLYDKFGLLMPMDGNYFYYNYWSGERSYVPSDFVWQKHNFNVDIRLVYNFDLEEETSLGYYQKSYDILDWNNSQLTNDDLNTNYNPSLDDGGNPVVLPSDNGSSVVGGNQTSGSGGVSASGGSALAYVAEGAVQIAIQQQSQGGFQLSAQGWNDYGNFYRSAANALKDLATGSGDFPQVVQAAGSFLPSAIWGLVLAGVATSVCIGLWSGVRNH